MMEWDGIKTSILKGTAKVPSSKDAPCAPVSMLHTFLRMENIIKTIQFNLPTRNMISQIFPHGNADWGCPIWENFPRNSKDKESVRNATTTYLGRLVPLSRAIKIDENRIMMGDGLIYPSFTDDPKKSVKFPVPEQSATIRVINKGRNGTDYTVLSYDADVKVWRELAAICIKRKTNEIGGPLCLNLLSENQSFDIHVLALSRNKASILDTFDSVYHLPAQITEETGRSCYESEVKKAEDIERRLNRAIEKYRKTYDGGWEGRVKGAGSSKGELLDKLHSIASTHYWTAVEKSINHLFALVKSIETTKEQVDTNRKIWRKHLWNCARESYSLACPNNTPRKMTAFALGWKALNAIYEKDPNSTENKEE